jgi:hypothetical protein
LSHAALDATPRSFPDGPPFTWAIDDSFLKLVGPDFVCRFTPHGNRFSQRRGQGNPVSRAVAAERTERYRVVEASVEEEARSIRFERKVGDPAQHRAATVDDLTRGTDANSLIREVAIATTRGALTVDFGRMLVAAEPDESVRELALVAARCLTPLLPGEDVLLEAFLGRAQTIVTASAPTTTSPPPPGSVETPELDLDG